MKTKPQYFLLYTLGFSLSTTIIGYLSFLLLKSYLLSNMDPKLDDWMVVMAIFISMLPFSISIGSRVLKHEIEKEQKFEKFIHIFSQSIFLFVLGIAAVTLFIQSLSKWILPASNNKQLSLDYFEILSSGILFWLKTFPLNLCAILILLSLIYSINKSIDKRVFGNKIVSKKEITNLSIHFIPLLFRVYLVSLFSTTLVLGMAAMIVDFFALTHEQLFYLGSKQPIIFSAIINIPYALLITFHIWVVKYLGNVKFKFVSIILSLLISSIFGVILFYFIQGIWISMTISHAFLFAFNYFSEGFHQTFIVSFINIYIVLLFIPLNLFWYKYIEQILITRLQKDNYEHLVEEV